MVPASDSTDVYWVGGSGQTIGSVHKVSLDGGSTTTLAPSQSASGRPEIGITSSAVFWITTSAVYSVPKSGGTVSTLVSGLTLGESDFTPGAFSVDETSVYIRSIQTTGATSISTVMSVPVAGGAPTTLAVRTGSVLGMVHDATSLYWIESVPQLTDAGVGSGSITCNVISLTPK